MRVSRFFTTDDKGSKYDEVDIPLIEREPDKWGNQIAMSERFHSDGVCIFEISDGAFQDWHNAPTRQLCVVLEGEWEVETSNGVKVSWGRGEMFLPDDVDGTGHISRVLRGPVRILFVPLPVDFDITHWQLKATSHD